MTKVLVQSTSTSRLNVELLIFLAEKKKDLLM